MRGIFFIICFFLSSSILHAAYIPRVLKDYLLHTKKKPELVKQFESISVLSPEQFIERFIAAGPTTAMGAGFNGVVFKDQHDGMFKLVFSIYGACGKIKLDENSLQMNNPDLKEICAHWHSFFDKTPHASANITALRNWDSAVGSQPIYAELIGTLLWAIYSPRPVDFPSAVSSDGLAFDGKFYESVTLKAILESQRAGTDLHKKYDFQKLWNEVVFWQRVGEIMLQDSGLTVDLVTPGNFLVMGDPQNPSIQIIDRAPVRPSPEALDYFKEKGVNIPEPVFVDEEFLKQIRLIIWPIIPGHIVSNGLWGLNLEQSLSYLKTYYNLETRREALYRLSRQPKLNIVEAPFLNRFENIDFARKRVKKSKKSYCEPMASEPYKSRRGPKTFFKSLRDRKI